MKRKKKRRNIPSTTTEDGFEAFFEAALDGYDYIACAGEIQEGRWFSP